MGKVGRLRNKVEHFAALFWAFGEVLSTPDPARRPGLTPPPYTKHIFFYRRSWFNFQRRCVAPPPLPPLSCMIFTVYLWLKWPKVKMNKLSSGVYTV